MPLIPQQEPPYYTLGTGGTGLTKYIALLNQTGTDAPIATIIQNTLSATPIWTRSAAGQYVLTLIDAFTTDKTTVLLGGINQGIAYYVENFSPDVTEIGVRNLAGTLTDELFNNTTIEITVYP